MTERCEEDKATISRSLDFLEENGYVYCESKNVKRYKNPLLLTEKAIDGIFAKLAWMFFTASAENIRG